MIMVFTSKKKNLYLDTFFFKRDTFLISEYSAC